MTGPAERRAWTAGLRQIADFLDAHDEVPLPYLGAYAEGSSKPVLPIYLTSTEEPRQAMAMVMKAMGRATKAAHDDIGTFQVWREFAGLVLMASAHREAVCERIVTGTRTVEVDEPVTEVTGTRKVTKVIEDVQWKCSPLLPALETAKPKAAAA